MRAVLNATGYQLGLEPLLFYRPTPLLNIVDKPVIVHIIETLAQEGIRQFDIILNHLPDMIENRLKDGRRWGVSIVYHLARDYRYPFATLRAISYAWKDSAVLFGQGDTLPKFSKQDFTARDSENPLLFMYQDHLWSGWGIFNPLVFLTIPTDTTVEELPGLLRRKEARMIPHFLSVQTLNELQNSNNRFISRPPHVQTFPSTAHMVEPEMWIARGVMIHPTAKITSPVYIGDNCQIKEHAQIGPHAIIEKNCIIDARSKIDHSLIFRRSYIGEGLEIHNSIVDRNLLINLALDAHVTIKDDFILGELNTLSLCRILLNRSERVLALPVFILLLPFYLYMRLSHNIKREGMLEIPAGEEPLAWRKIDKLSFEPKPGIIQSRFQKYWTYLPLLINVMRGQMHFVGVVPRKPSDVEHLSSDWKRLYLRSKAGIITQSDLDYGTSGTPDECYASEIYYTVHMGLRHDIKLFFIWLSHKISSLFSLFSKDRHHA